MKSGALVFGMMIDQYSTSVRFGSPLKGKVLAKPPFSGRRTVTVEPDAVPAA